MILTIINEAAPVAPPAYHRAQDQLGPALHIDALTLVTTLHLLVLCRLAVRLAHHRCPPPLPCGPGGAPRTYSEASLLLIALLRTLWRLSRPGICTIGYVTGLPLPWRVACQKVWMACLVFPVPRSNASVAIEQGLRCQKRSLSLVSWQLSVVG
jgi:hypothetical protein